MSVPAGRIFTIRRVAVRFLHGSHVAPVGENFQEPVSVTLPVA